MPASWPDALALAWVFQTITDEVGRREVAGQDHPEIAAALRPMIEDLFDSIDLWLTTGPHKPTYRMRGEGIE